MKRITQEEAMARLSTGKVRIGSRVRVRYEAGLPRTREGRLEAQTAIDRGLDLQVFVGSLEAVGLNKKGEFYFTLFTPDRDTIEADGTRRRGQFRSFNPSLGELYALRVIDLSP